MFTGTRKRGGINSIPLKLTSVIFVGSSSSSGSKINKLTGEAARKAYYHWRACIFSGGYVKIVIVEKAPVSMGYCKKLERWIDFELECTDCKKHKITRTPPKHERTPTRKARIGTARRRSIAKSKDLFEMRQRRKKH